MLPQPVLNHFKTADPVLYQAAITLSTPFEVRRSPHLFISLCESIIGQQLSTKVGDVLCERFRKLFEDQKITPERVVKLTPETIRAIGTSNSKARYILDLATKVVSGEINLEQIAEMPNEQVITELTKVKGIGPWTAEMFLMFTLGREDVFSTGDLGLKRGIQKIYHLSHEPSKEELETISLKWSPYRTYASMILWRMLDNTP